MDRNIRSRFSIFLSPMFLSGNGFGEGVRMMFNTPGQADSTGAGLDLAELNAQVLARSLTTHWIQVDR
jgi:hypothetical protein